MLGMTKLKVKEQKWKMVKYISKYRTGLDLTHIFTPSLSRALLKLPVHRLFTLSPSPKPASKGEEDREDRDDEPGHTSPGDSVNRSCKPTAASTISKFLNAHACSSDSKPSSLSTTSALEAEDFILLGSDQSESEPRKAREAKKKEERSDSDIVITGAKLVTGNHRLLSLTKLKYNPPSLSFLSSHAGTGKLKTMPRMKDRWPSDLIKQTAMIEVPMFRKTAGEQDVVAQYSGHQDSRLMGLVVALDLAKIRSNVNRAFGLANADAPQNHPVQTSNLLDTIRRNLHAVCASSDSDGDQYKTMRQDVDTACPSDSDSDLSSPGYCPSPLPSVATQDEDDQPVHNIMPIIYLLLVCFLLTISDILDVTYPIDAYLMNPNVWEPPLDSLRSFISPNWVDGMIMDIWLIKFWANLGQDDHCYVPMSYLMPGQESSSQEPSQIQTFHRGFSLPLTGPYPLQTVVSCLCRHSHYFTVIINPSNKTMHILGRSHLSNNFVAQLLVQVSWDWDLLEVWSKVATLHGWDFDLDFNVYELNWEQNGNDCGPIVCQVLEHIWIHGFHVSASGRWLKPESLPCCHFIRRQIISDFQVQVLDWSRVEAWAVLDPSNLDMTGALILWIKQEMDRQAHSCFSCCPPNSLVEQSTTQLEPSPPWFLHKRQISKPSINWLPLPAPPPADSEPGNDKSSEADVPPLQKKKKVQKPRNPHPYALDRFPRPTSPPSPTVLRNSDALFLSSERPYDDYENGPTSEVLNPIPNTILMLGEIDLVYLADNIISNPWRNVSMGCTQQL
ncbi:hypothetical protein F5887DRAFT_1088627 [Amanita rubescens]|nr:hypothetical protein F5887DRAFT_1088627 [Amanita rubescens]